MELRFLKAHLKCEIYVQKNANRKNHKVNHYPVTKPMENILRPRIKI